MNQHGIFCKCLDCVQHPSYYAATGDNQFILAEHNTAMRVQEFVSAETNSTASASASRPTVAPVTPSSSSQPIQVFVQSHDGTRQVNSLHPLDVDLEVQPKCRYCNQRGCRIVGGKCNDARGQRKCSVCGALGHNKRGCGTKRLTIQHVQANLVHVFR